jgi:hypothetical protein
MEGKSDLAVGSARRWVRSLYKEQTRITSITSKLDGSCTELLRLNIAALLSW